MIPACLMWHVTASEAYLLLAVAVLQPALQKMPLVPVLRCPDLRGHLHRELYMNSTIYPFKDKLNALPISASSPGCLGRLVQVWANYLSLHLGGSHALNSMTASTCRPIKQGSRKLIQHDTQACARQQARLHL